MKKMKKPEWILREKVYQIATNSRKEVIEISGGRSPYSNFDIIICDEDFELGKTPANYILSDIEIKTADPQTAYKGRHGSGRLFYAKPNPEGLILVQSWENPVLVLCDGTPLGIPNKITLGDLFPADSRII